jgi:hypothetical protein
LLFTCLGTSFLKKIKIFGQGNQKLFKLKEFSYIIDREN